MRKRFERFCLKHRDKGIPNLMLYITLGSGLVFIMSLVSDGAILYNWLCFDKAAILQGQVWRLITYVFTYPPGSNVFLILIGLYFFYNISRAVEQRMGTLRFNLFYFSGMVLMSVFAMIFCPTDIVIIDNYLIHPAYFTSLYSQMALYLNLSITLLFCTTCPATEFLVFFILPVKAWFLSLVDLLLIALSIYSMSYPVMLFPHNLFPLVGIINFLLFAGRDVLYLLPPGLRPGPHRPRASKPTPRKPAKPIPFPNQQSKPASKPSLAYNHRCTVCGRTDVTDPDLEFRYCSRCSGYYCYCADHIGNHTHIE